MQYSYYGNRKRAPRAVRPLVPWPICNSISSKSNGFRQRRPEVSIPSDATAKGKRQKPYGPSPMRIARMSYLGGEIGYKRVARDYPVCGLTDHEVGDVFVRLTEKGSAESQSGSGAPRGARKGI